MVTPVAFLTAAMTCSFIPLVLWVLKDSVMKSVTRYWLLSSLRRVAKDGTRVGRAPRIFMKLASHRFVE